MEQFDFAHIQKRVAKHDEDLYDGSERGEPMSVRLDRCERHMNNSQKMWVAVMLLLIGDIISRHL